jgi:L-malate glycosyltransferase
LGKSYAGRTWESWVKALSKRVLYFSRDYTPHDHRFLTALGNTEYQVFHLRLEKRGHTLEDRSLPPQIEQLSWAGGQSPAGRGDGPRLLLDLKRVLRSIKPDLVQAGPVQRVAFLTALAGFRPLVSTSWGYDLLVEAEIDYLWRWATRYTLKRTAVLVGDCRTIRERAISYGMPDERIVTFPWGVDLRKFTPGRGEDRQVIWPSYVGGDSSGQVFVLLSTRSWEPIYGVGVIARAFILASHRLAGKDCPELRLLMLGNGSQASQLREIFMQGGVLGQVHFPGHVNQVDLPRYYRSSDLYLSASHSDGSSISLLEAMACGLPALVSDIPGNREWITPGEDGWWFPDGDHQALADAIVYAIEQREHLSVMGSNARKVAEQRADWELNFPKLLDAYEMAIEWSKVSKDDGNPTLR